MWRFLRNRRLILRLHYYLGTHILGASRGGPCDSTALVRLTVILAVKSQQVAFDILLLWQSYNFLRENMVILHIQKLSNLL